MKSWTVGPINGDQRPYAKVKIMKLGHGEHRVWFTSGIGETWISNGFHAGKSNLV
jgi:hypothetical protein